MDKCLKNPLYSNKTQSGASTPHCRETGNFLGRGILCAISVVLIVFVSLFAIMPNIGADGAAAAANVTLFFYADEAGASLYMECEIEVGTALPYAPDPLPTAFFPAGYEFDIWVTSEGEFDYTAPIAANISIYPTFKKLSYTVNYLYPFGESPVIWHTESVIYQETAPVLSAPDLPGRILGDWVDSEGESYDFNKPVTKNTDIYAKYGYLTARTISVYLDDNYINSYQEGALYMPTASVVVGKLFDGFYTDAAFSEPYNGSVVSETTELHIYSKYIDKSYTLTIMPFEDYCVILHRYEGEEVAIPAYAEPDFTPALAGFNLCGFYIDSEFNLEYFPTAVTGDFSLYPKFERAEYTVRFLGIDGEVISSETVLFYDTPNEPAEIGNEYYLFMGWDNEVGATVGDVDYQAVFEEYAMFTYYYGGQVVFAEKRLKNSAPELETPPILPHLIYVGMDTGAEPFTFELIYTEVVFKLSVEASTHLEVSYVGELTCGNYITVYVTAEDGYWIDTVRVAGALGTVPVDEMYDGSFGFYMPDCNVLLVITETVAAPMPTDDGGATEDISIEEEDNGSKILFYSAAVTLAVFAVFAVIQKGFRGKTTERSNNTDLDSKRKRRKNYMPDDIAEEAAED